MKHPKEDYPYNVLMELDIAPEYTDDQLAGLQYLESKLTEREKELYDLRFKEKMVLKDIAVYLGLSSSRPQQIISRILCKMHANSNRDYVLYGKEGNEQRKAIIRQTGHPLVDDIEKIPIESSDIPMQCSKYLIDTDITTIGELMEVAKRKGWYKSVEGIGPVKAQLIANALLGMGIKIRV